MEYRSAIVDECLCVMYWHDELSEDEVEQILDIHPEWRIMSVEVR